MNHAHQFYAEYLALRAKVKAQILTSLYGTLSLPHVQIVDKALECNKDIKYLVPTLQCFSPIELKELLDLAELYIDLRDSSPA